MIRLMKTTICIILFCILGIEVASSQKQSSSKISVKNPEKTFIGAILKPESINKTDHEFVTATLNPITISSANLTMKSMEIVPSYKNMMDAVRKRVQEGASLNQGHILFSAVQELKSYKDISFHFGQTIDPDLYLGTKDGKKSKKTLVALIISRSIISLDMDFPDELSSDKDILAQADKLIYIASVEIGRNALVIVESDKDKKDVIAAVNERLSQKKNRQAQTVSWSEAILANSIIRVVTPQDSHFEVTAPDDPIGDVWEYIYWQPTADDFGTPISFSAASLKDNALFVNEYEIK